MSAGLPGTTKNAEMYERKKRGSGAVPARRPPHGLLLEVQLVPRGKGGSLRTRLRHIDGGGRADAGEDDFSLMAGRGRFGTGKTMMPGEGCSVERAWTEEKYADLGDALPVLSKQLLMFLSGSVFWLGVRATVRRHEFGRYRDLKKWFSY